MYNFDAKILIGITDLTNSHKRKPASHPKVLDYFDLIRKLE